MDGIKKRNFINIMVVAMLILAVLFFIPTSPSEVKCGVMALEMGMVYVLILTRYKPGKREKERLTIALLGLFLLGLFLLIVGFASWVK